MSFKASIDDNKKNHRIKGHIQDTEMDTEWYTERDTKEKVLAAKQCGLNRVNRILEDKLNESFQKIY